MKKHNETLKNLIHMLTTESRSSLFELDTSDVSFDDRYYRKRGRQIRRYRHSLLTNTLEKCLSILIRYLLVLSLFCLTLILPLIPMIVAAIILIKVEEQRCRETSLSNMSF